MPNLSLRSLSDELKTIGEKQHLDRFIGNLRREKAVKALRHFHYLVPDCDEVGNLKNTQLFVQLVGVKFDEEIKYVLLCNAITIQRACFKFFSGQILRGNSIMRSETDIVYTVRL